MEIFIVFCTIISILCCVYFECQLIRLQKIIDNKKLIYSDYINEFWNKDEVNDSDLYS